MEIFGAALRRLISGADSTSLADADDDLAILYGFRKSMENLENGDWTIVM